MHSCIVTIRRRKLRRSLLRLVADIVYFIADYAPSDIVDSLQVSSIGGIPASVTTIPQPFSSSRFIHSVLFFFLSLLLSQVSYIFFRRFLLRLHGQMGIQFQRDFHEDSIDVCDQII